MNQILKCNQIEIVGRTSVYKLLRIFRDNYFMEPFPQFNNFQVLLNSLESQHQVERFTLFITGYLLEYIKVKTSAEINKIHSLIIILNTAVKDSLITISQRKDLIKQVVKQKYQNIELFQKRLNGIFEETVNKNLMGDSQPVSSSEDDLSEKLIQQLLKKEQQQKLERQRAEDQSLLLMKQLQLKDQQSYKNRFIQASKAEIKMDCPICLEEIKLAHLALLSCEHSFHKQCMLQHLMQNIDDRKFPLRCPGCEIECLESDITEYLTPEYMKIYQKLSFQNYVNMHHQDMSWCPTAGCQYVFCFDEDESEFNCPLCHKIYCLKCKVPFHNGLSCKEFNINRVFDKNDEKFIEFVKGAKYKQCPSCLFWVEKNEGCDHMTCRCKYEFCYVCGGKYQACQCMNIRNRRISSDDMLEGQQLLIVGPVRPVRPRIEPIRRPRPPGRPRQTNYKD